MFTEAWYLVMHTSPVLSRWPKAQGRSRFVYCFKAHSAAREIARLRVKESRESKMKWWTNEDPGWVELVRD